jgi:two-component system phosphate regulon response regulator PhoB
VPVNTHTARPEEIDRTVGIDLRADDNATKPFSVRELLLRISAILKRTASQAPVPSNDEERITFGILSIYPAAHRVWVAGSEVELSALEFKLLTRLHDCKNRVKSRAALLDEVWGMTADITTRTVDTHVKRLREKLGPARNYIETVRGVGYRFVETPGEADV